MNQIRDNADAYRNRTMSRGRRVTVGVFIILLLPLLFIAFTIARFDPNRYAPQIIAAVDQATGRQMTLGGPITLQWSLAPVVEVSDVRLSNPPGFADPDLATLGRVEAKIALLPLLSRRLDILKLVLVNPSVVLESGKTGGADWDLSQPGRGNESGPPGPQPAPANGSGFKIALEAVEIQNGQFSLKNSGGSAPVNIALPHLTGAADSLSAPLHLTANAVLGSTPFNLSGVVGPVERFSGIGAGPWPVDVTLQLGSATGAIQGTIGDPQTAGGYDLAVSVQIPALEMLAASLPPGLLNGLALPPIHDIDASARIVDQNSTIPAIDSLSIKAGASDLSSVRPGFALTALDIEMASLDQALSVTASGKLGSAALSLSGKFGAPQALFDPALLPATMPPQGSFPLSAALQVGDAKLSLAGAIATPETLAGVAMALNATIPDLGALGQAAGSPWPAWKNIVVQGTIIDPGGLGLRNASGLDGLTVTMDNAAFGGAGSLYFGARPRLQIALKFSRINMDALEAAIPPTPRAATPAAAPQASQTAANAGTIPDVQLPLNLLKSASADVQISADTLIWNQAAYTALQAHAVLDNGVLTLSPMTGQLPGGGVTANAVLDVTNEPAAESVHVNAPALALAPFLKALALPDTAQGTVQAQLNATGTGDNLPAIAASLDGQFGVAMVNGIVDGTLMDRLFGTVLRTVGLPAGLVGAQGPVAVRCAALRIDSTNGIGTIRALTMDSSRLLVQGGGSIDFAHETLGIILRPQLQVAGANVGVPVEIGGSFAAPTTSVAPLGAVRAAAGSAVGLPVGLAQDVLGNNSILGKAASLLGIGDGGDVCPAALSLGRLGQPGPAAPAKTAPTGPAGNSIRLPSGPKNLLNSIFGQ